MTSYVIKPHHEGNSLYQTRLQKPTSGSWVNVVLSEFGVFIADHASNERKAAAFAMDFVVRYPDKHSLVAAASKIAQQEIAHFRQVFKRMQKHGYELQADQKSSYMAQMNHIIRVSSSERLMDRMLICAAIELRGQERFELLSQFHPESSWRSFYLELYRSEQDHWTAYIDESLKLFSVIELECRWSEILNYESKLITSLPVNCRLFP